MELFFMQLVGRRRQQEARQQVLDSSLHHRSQLDSARHGETTPCPRPAFVPHQRRDIQGAGGLLKNRGPVSWAAPWTLVVCPEQCSGLQTPATAAIPLTQWAAVNVRPLSMRLHLRRMCLLMPPNLHLLAADAACWPGQGAGRLD